MRKFGGPNKKRQKCRLRQCLNKSRVGLCRSVLRFFHQLTSSAVWRPDIWSSKILRFSRVMSNILSTLYSTIYLYFIFCLIWNINLAFTGWHYTWLSKWRALSGTSEGRASITGKTSTSTVCLLNHPSSLLPSLLLTYHFFTPFPPLPMSPHVVSAHDIDEIYILEVWELGDIMRW